MHGTYFKIKGIIVFVYLVAYNGNSRDQPHYQPTDNAYYNDNMMMTTTASPDDLFLSFIKKNGDSSIEGPAHRQNLIFVSHLRSLLVRSRHAASWVENKNQIQNVTRPHLMNAMFVKCKYHGCTRHSLLPLSTASLHTHQFKWINRNYNNFFRFRQFMPKHLLQQT